jgi:O-antigen/teichoic acid export membrane protein
MLGVENLGKVNFTIAVISYFSLLAGLGTRNYAIREGGIVRNYTARRTIFFNEIYSINMAATVLSYLLLACSLFAFPVLRSYTGLLLIYSIVIIGRTFGVDWMC